MRCLLALMLCATVAQSQTALRDAFPWGVETDTIFSYTPDTTFVFQYGDSLWFQKKGGTAINLLRIPDSSRAAFIADSLKGFTKLTAAQIRALLTATAPLSYVNSTGEFSISQANASTDGYLTKEDFTSFAGKMDSVRVNNLLGTKRDTSGTIDSSDVKGGSTNFTQTVKEIAATVASGGVVIASGDIRHRVSNDTTYLDTPDTLNVVRVQSTGQLDIVAGGGGDDMVWSAASIRGAVFGATSWQYTNNASPPTLVSLIYGAKASIPVSNGATATPVTFRLPHNYIPFGDSSKSGGWDSTLTTSWARNFLKAATVGAARDSLGLKQIVAGTGITISTGPKDTIKATGGTPPTIIFIQDTSGVGWTCSQCCQS